MTNRIHSEQAVLGCCMAEPKAYWKIADLLTPDDFSVGAHVRLFTEISARARSGDAFDAVTIADDCPQYRDLAFQVSDSEGWRAGNVLGYAENVASAAMVRRVRQAGSLIARLEGEEALSEAQRLLSACVPRNSGAIKHIREYMRASAAEITRRMEITDKITGIPTSIAALDEMTEGWQPGDLVIVAARPSVGKTAFAMQCALTAAKAQRTVLVFSMEMTGKQVNDRATSALGPIDGKLLRQPKRMQEEDWAAWSRANEEIHGLSIYVDESSGSTVDVICARARQHHALYPLGMIVIDYLTMIKPPKANTMAEALQQVTRSLKGLAKDLNVPVLLLSQLNRGGEGHRPTMATLRDSGAIEQDADLILFLHRPSATHRDFLELILEKQRNGPVGVLALDANMRVMRFDQSEQKPAGVESNAQTAADFEWDSAGVDF